MKNKTLYALFDCSSKEELYDKLKKEDPSVKDLNSFYKSYSSTRGKGRKVFNSQSSVMNIIVEDGYLPVEGAYTALGMNTKNEMVSYVKFTEEDSFKDVFKQLNVKGFCNVIMVENFSHSKSPQCADNFTCPDEIKFEDEFENLGVNILDYMYVDSLSTNNKYRLDSSLHINSGQLGFSSDKIVFEEPHIKYRTKENSTLDEMSRYDEFSFYFSKKELHGLNIFDDEEKIDELLVIGNSGFGKEYLQVVSFDDDYNIEDISIESIGGVNSTIAHPLTMSNTLLNCTKGFILLHNHPSGKTDPSDADLAVTERFMNVADSFEKEMLDHYIVGDDVNHLSETVYAPWADKLLKNKTDLKEDYRSDKQLTLFEEKTNYTFEKCWIQTDEKQFVKQLSDSEFKIYDEIIYGSNAEYTNIFYGTIDISDYTDEELNEAIYGYYDDLEEIKEIYDSDWQQIVAECIAEQSEHEYRLDDFSIESFWKEIKQENDLEENFILDNELEL